MHIFYHILLCITYCAIFIHCLVETSHFNENGLFDSINTSCSSVNCRQRTAIIVGTIIGGGIGIILFITGVLFFYRYCKNRPSQTNLTFVNATNYKNNKYKLYDATLFKSGTWLSRYLQFGIWHGFYRFSLSFDYQSFEVTGSGSDNIGIFSINGTYSIRTGRMGLTKTYQLGTINRSNYFGHQVIIQLTWNSETCQFEGKWYMQTKKYYIEDKFELKFSKQQQSFPNEKV